MASANRIIIAHLSVWKTVLFATPLFLAACVALRLTVLNENGPFHYVAAHPASAFSVFIVDFCALAGVIYYFYLMYLILFRGRAGVWIEVKTGRLVFVHRAVRSLLLKEFDSVAAETVSGYGYTFHVLAFRSKSHPGSYNFATGMLAENREIIIDRLRAAGWMRE